MCRYSIMKERTGPSSSDYSLTSTPTTTTIVTVIIDLITEEMGCKFFFNAMEKFPSPYFLKGPSFALDPLKKDGILLYFWGTATIFSLVSLTVYEQDDPAASQPWRPCQGGSEAVSTSWTGRKRISWVTFQFGFVQSVFEWWGWFRYKRTSDSWVLVYGGKERCHPSPRCQLLITMMDRDPRWMTEEQGREKCDGLLCRKSKNTRVKARPKSSVERVVEATACAQSSVLLDPKW